MVTSQSNAAARDPCRVQTQPIASGFESSHFRVFARSVSSACSDTLPVLSILSAPQQRIVSQAADHAFQARRQGWMPGRDRRRIFSFRRASTLVRMHAGPSDF